MLCRSCPSDSAIKFDGRFGDPNNPDDIAQIGARINQGTGIKAEVGTVFVHVHTDTLLAHLLRLADVPDPPDGLPFVVNAQR